jgi:acyl carrier protein
MLEEWPMDKQTEDVILARLRAILRTSSPKPGVDWNGVTAESRIDALGFDSLAILDLIYDIQNAFRIQFEPADLAQVRTVGELAAFLISKGA